MDIINPMMYDVEEDELREHTKYNQMDRLLPEEFPHAADTQAIAQTVTYQLDFLSINIAQLDDECYVLIWGYPDNNFRLNMTKHECFDFVLKGITLAIIRDGCACFAIIDHNSVERVDILGNDLPQVVDL
ncbi:unnamed protein product [Adineta steineri]|uniref:Uncharacterized protein n=1 Tax=Adineta steineri TaxID=433720 RepID=A0A814M6R7_9BILA|nr:unnamed protein product [Adineta steineri]CAF3578553.1 unnamed protein product [Adineta steineri]